MLDVSACVNVRDDELTIGRWLDMMLPRAEEVIVCDTGSADRTQEIVAARAADEGERLRLIHAPWRGFVDGRNRFFSVASHGAIVQVDVDEVVPSSFWNNAQACLPAIEAGYLDSVRLRHFRDDREWAGFEDVDRRAGGLVDMRLFSYPRDILYSRMCPDRGVIWAAFEGTEVMNQLLGARAVIASDPLVHSYPRGHKMRDPEYHARKMLSYAKSGLAWQDAWTHFLDANFGPERTEAMWQEVLAEPDPAPHAAWWGRQRASDRAGEQH